MDCISPDSCKEPGQTQYIVDWICMQPYGTSQSILCACLRIYTMLLTPDFPLTKFDTCYDAPFFTLGLQCPMAHMCFNDSTMASNKSSSSGQASKHWISFVTSIMLDNNSWTLVVTSYLIARSNSFVQSSSSCLRNASSMENSTTWGLNKKDFTILVTRFKLLMRLICDINGEWTWVVILRIYVVI